MKIQVNGYVTLQNGETKEDFYQTIKREGWSFVEESTETEPYLLIRSGQEPQVVHLNNAQVQLMNALARWYIEFDPNTNLIPLRDLETLSI